MVNAKPFFSSIPYYVKLLTLIIWRIKIFVYYRHTLEGLNSESTNDITCICSSDDNPNALYVACETSIIVTDLRKLPSIIHKFNFNEEEICSLSIHSNNQYLAACDDSGQVKIVNLETKCLYKTLRKHTSICSSVVFLPNRSKELFSAGYDNQLLRWNYTKNKAHTCIDVTHHILSDFSDRDSAVHAQPFIHKIDITKDGCMIACGTEDGLVHLLDCSGNSTNYLCKLAYHRRGVSQVHFTLNGSTTLLVSAGKY